MCPVKKKHKYDISMNILTNSNCYIENQECAETGLRSKIKVQKSCDIVSIMDQLNESYCTRWLCLAKNKNINL